MLVVMLTHICHGDLVGFVISRSRLIVALFAIWSMPAWASLVLVVISQRLRSITLGAFLGFHGNKNAPPESEI